MKLHVHLKVILLLTMSGIFLICAFLTYKVSPQSLSLWLPLSFFGSVSLLFTVILGIRLYLITKDGDEESV